MKKRHVHLSHFLLVSVALSSLYSPDGSAEPQAVPDDRLNPGTTQETPVIAPGLTEAERGVTDVAASAPTATAAPIRGIRFKGAEVPAVVAAATEPFLGKPADTATLKDLAAAMSAAYKKSDVALFTLAIPAQDLSDGVVEILIAEGHVAEVITRTDGQISERLQLRGYLRPVMAERPASRESYERGMMLARRAEGTKVTPGLRTAKEPGAVILVLDVEDKKDGFAVGYDSRESRLVDSGRFSASGFVYGKLRAGDALRGRISFTPDGRQSRSASLQYSTPVGTDGLTFTAAGAYQETRPSLIPIEGDANFLAASVSYPAILNFRQEVSINAAIDRTESSNTALGAVIANENIAAARLGAKASWIQPKRSAGLNLSLAQGLDIGDTSSSVTGANTQFTKLNGSGSLVQVIGEDLHLRLKASGQWTDDVLPANERLMIGGIEYGRGFSNGLVSLDKGYVVSFEPAWRPLDDGPFSRSEIYVFADYAEGSIIGNGAGGQSFDLSSAGIGARIAYKKYATLGLEMAEPLSLPVRGLDDNAIFTVTWALRYQPD
ncbi:MAG: ShlB/FhaC/HecB family hemolysin secretion/activation protein [Hyphomonas sp.]